MRIAILRNDFKIFIACELISLTEWEVCPDLWNNLWCKRGQDNNSHCLKVPGLPENDRVTSCRCDDGYYGIPKRTSRRDPPSCKKVKGNFNFLNETYQNINFKLVSVFIDNNVKKICCQERGIVKKNKTGSSMSTGF